MAYGVGFTIYPRRVRQCMAFYNIFNNLIGMVQICIVYRSTVSRI